MSRLRSASHVGRWIILGAVVAAASFASTSKFNRPMRTLGGWGSDHISHVFSALLFGERGYRIYTEPPSRLLEPAPNSAALAREFRWDPEGVFVRPGNGVSLALLINWPHVPRAYPPGSALVHGPIAWLYAARVIGIDGAARSAVALYALAAVAASIQFWPIVIRMFRNAQVAGIPERVGAAVAIAAVAICVSQLFLWAFEGFYDPIFVLCLIVALSWYVRARWNTALLWYAVALALHFRALWFAPLAIACLWQRYQDTRLGKVRRVIDGTFVVALFIGAAAMAAFLLFYGHLVPGETWQIRSRLYLWSSDFSPARLTMVALASTVTAAVLWWHHDRLGAAIVITIAMLLPGIPQVEAWHSLALVPLVFHCGQRGSASLAAVACAFYAFLGLVVFDAHVVDWQKLRALITTVLS